MPNHQPGVRLGVMEMKKKQDAEKQAAARGAVWRIRPGMVAPMFISRWDKAVAGKVPEEPRDRLGIAVAKQACRAYRELLDPPRWGAWPTKGEAAAAARPWRPSPTTAR